MSKSLWKPEFLHNELIVQQQKVKEKGFIILQNRASRILEYMIGYNLQIYNGIRYFSVVVNSEMVGHCVGEFAFTRQKPVLKKKKTVKK